MGVMDGVTDLIPTLIVGKVVMDISDNAFEKKEVGVGSKKRVVTRKKPSQKKKVDVYVKYRKTGGGMSPL
jgi:hypothetical protein